MISLSPAILWAPSTLNVLRFTYSAVLGSHPHVMSVGGGACQPWHFGLEISSQLETLRPKKRALGKCQEDCLRKLRKHLLTGSLCFCCRPSFDFHEVAVSDILSSAIHFLRQHAGGSCENRSDFFQNSEFQEHRSGGLFFSCAEFRIFTCSDIRFPKKSDMQKLDNAGDK